MREWKVVKLQECWNEDEVWVDKPQTRQAGDWPIVNNKHGLPGAGLSSQYLGGEKVRKQAKRTKIKITEV